MPVLSSPSLEIRPKRSRMTDNIMTANRAVHKGNYTVAFDLYSKILHEKRHPVAYLNRALCYTAERKPHLAVNDALRAYMMAQATIDVNRDRVAGNDHIRRIDRDISSYRGMCTLGTNFAGLHHLDVCLEQSLSNTILPRRAYDSQESAQEPS